MVAVLTRHVNARRCQRNLLAGRTHGFHRRELLDELEVGVDHLDAGRKRLHLREARSAVSFASPRARARAQPHRHTPTPPVSRTRAASAARQQRSTTAADAVELANRHDDVAVQVDVKCLKLEHRSAQAKRSSRISWLSGRFWAISSSSSESTWTVVPFCTSVHQVDSGCPGRPLTHVPGIPGTTSPSRTSDGGAYPAPDRSSSISGRRHAVFAGPRHSGRERYRRSSLPALHPPA